MDKVVSKTKSKVYTVDFIWNVFFCEKSMLRKNIDFKIWRCHIQFFSYLGLQFKTLKEEIIQIIPQDNHNLKLIGGDLMPCWTGNFSLFFSFSFFGGGGILFCCV